MRARLRTENLRAIDAVLIDEIRNLPTEVTEKQDRCPRAVKPAGSKSITSHPKQGCWKMTLCARPSLDALSINTSPSGSPSVRLSLHIQRDLESSSSPALDRQIISIQRSVSSCYLQLQPADSWRSCLLFILDSDYSSAWSRQKFAQTCRAPAARRRRRRCGNGSAPRAELIGRCCAM